MRLRLKCREGASQAKGVEREWEGRSQWRAPNEQRPQGRKEIGVFEELKERRNGRRYRGREARLALLIVVLILYLKNNSLTGEEKSTWQTPV